MNRIGYCCLSLFIVLASAGLCSAGTAPVFYNVSGFSRDAIFTFTDVDGAGDRSSTSIKLTDGILDPSENHMGIRVDSDDQRIGCSLWVDYDGGHAGLQVFGTLLELKNGGSGCGQWIMEYPDYSSIPATVGKGTLWTMTGSCKVHIITSGSRTVVLLTNVTVGWAAAQAYSSDGAGNVAWGANRRLDGNAAVPPLNVWLAH